MSQAPRQMHLGVFVLGTGNHSAGWRYAGAATSNNDLSVIQEIARIAERGRFDLGCSTSLSCISKGFGGFYSRLWRLRTGKLSSALRLHGFAHIFGHPSGDILDANRAQRLGHEVLGEFTAHARNQQD